MPSLKDQLTKGTVLAGLKALLADANVGEGQAGTIVSEGVVRASWSTSKKLLGNRVVTFTAAPEHGTLRVLPYRAGATNAVPAGGLPVISGEFNGCIMAEFKLKDGVLRVGHVCTDRDLFEGLAKKSWEAMAGDGQVDVVRSLSTKDLVADRVFASAEAKRASLALNMKILCIATPGEGISKHFVLREDDKYKVI